METSGTTIPLAVMTAPALSVAPVAMTAPVLMLTLDLTGKDSTFISNCYRYLSGLNGLPLYQSASHPLLNLDQVKTYIDSLQLTYEVGATGSRVHIAARNQLRQQVTDMFRRIIYYLQSVATEADIPALMQAGFQVGRHTGGKKRSAHQQA